jgi:hypothetical protein
MTSSLYFIAMVSVKAGGKNWPECGIDTTAEELRSIHLQLNYFPQRKRIAVKHQYI